MAAIVREAVAAGALGFSTSRTIVHRAINGEPVPGTFAAEDELFAIGRALGELGQGVFELAPAGAMGEDLAAPAREVDWMRRLSREIRRPITFALNQNDVDKDLWREVLRLVDDAAARRREHPPAGRLARDDAADRPPDLPPVPVPAELSRRSRRCRSTERVARLRDPAVKKALLAEENQFDDPRLMVVLSLIANRLDKVFPLGDPPDYEPGPEQSIAAIAQREGRDAFDVLYDRLLERDGRELLMLTILGYSDGDLEAVRAMLEHPPSAFGLGDARRALRRDLRRVHDDVPAHALGARPEARPEAPAALGGAQDDARDGDALRARRPRRRSRRARRATST